MTTLSTRCRRTFAKAHDVSWRKRSNRKSMSYPTNTPSAAPLKAARVWFAMAICLNANSRRALVRLAFASRKSERRPVNRSRFVRSWYRLMSVIWHPLKRRHRPRQPRLFPSTATPRAPLREAYRIFGGCRRWACRAPPPVPCGSCWAPPRIGR